MKVATPFEHRVPNTMRENLLWRRRALERVAEEPEYATVLREACAVDPIFYVNGFCHTYDPRCQPYARLPFILYDFQREGLLEILSAIGSHDLLVEKSRDMGASCVCAAAFEWVWHWFDDISLLMGSRTENYVDDKENPKSLFWKIDFMLKHQPSFIRPFGYNERLHRRKLHMLNPRTNSVIDGESTTGQFARGDRRTAILLDEFAAVEQGRRILEASQAATNSRIFNSTPLGTGNAYYYQRQMGTRRLAFHWRDHPEKSIGLYETSSDGELKILKPGLPDGYSPILDGKLRSPAYDIEEARGGKRLMAQEWDINYLESGDQFFDPQCIDHAITNISSEPIFTGRLQYDLDTGAVEGLRVSLDGPHSRERSVDAEFWFEPRPHDSLGQIVPPPGQSYVIGVDVAAGTGSSNSVLSVYSVQSHEKVMEFASPYTRPEALAVMAVAYARWFNDAKIGWETNGPGLQFGAKVMDLHYGNVFYRRKEDNISKDITKKPGWHSTRDTKLILLSKYRSGVESKRCLNRSEVALQECREYIFQPDGSVAHARAGSSDDPSGANENHGDRVIADAVAWFMLDGGGASAPAAANKEPPVGSLAWRIKRREEEKRRRQSHGLGEGWGR
jgi:hypothetical protein